ncbi:hypothetical protein K2Q16_00425 [Patescibacteria group bacterium]|nr:hypothetical protein [Patescibacteria group bacterium]
MKRHFLDYILLHPPELELAERFFELVREHPELCVLENETHYFSSDKISHGKGWYEAHYDTCSPGTKRGEVSTSYLTAPGVASRVARDYPDARLAVLITDPLEIVAERFLNAKKGQAAPADLETWLERQPHLLDSLKFGKHLTSFFAYYSPVDLLVMTSADVRTNAGEVIIKLFDHLEVSKTFVPKVLRVLTEDEVKPGLLARKLRLDRWRKRRRDKRLAIANSVFPKDTTVLGARERVLLARYFEHDLEQLSALVHRDLRAEWRHPAPEKKGHKKH